MSLIILPKPLSFIQGLTDIYGNGIQKIAYDKCKEAFGEDTCARQGLSTSSVYTVDGPAGSLHIGEELIALFVVGTFAFIVVLLNEVTFFTLIVYHYFALIVFLFLRFRLKLFETFHFTCCLQR